MTTKRTAILEATLALIAEHGFHGTAMSMIADRAGVGAGTIYRYFDSKEDLITQLYLEIKRQKGKAVLAGYSEDLSLRERFRTLWFNMLRYYMDHPQELAFLEQFDNSPYRTAEVKEAFAEYYEPLVAFLPICRPGGRAQRDAAGHAVRLYDGNGRLAGQTARRRGVGAGRRDEGAGHERLLGCAQALATRSLGGRLATASFFDRKGNECSFRPSRNDNLPGSSCREQCKGRPKAREYGMVIAAHQLSGR